MKTHKKKYVMQMMNNQSAYDERLVWNIRKNNI